MWLDIALHPYSFSQDDIYLKLIQSQTKPFFWLRGPERDTETSVWHSRRASTKRLKCTITVLPPRCLWVTQGCGGGQWLRQFGAMTSVLLEATERSKKWELGSWMQLWKTIKLQVNWEKERWEERLMGRVKGKQLQHRDSLFWSTAKGRSSLPLNR